MCYPLRNTGTRLTTKASMRVWSSKSPRDTNPGPSPPPSHTSTPSCPPSLTTPPSTGGPGASTVIGGDTVAAVASRRWPLVITTPRLCHVMSQAHSLHWTIGWVSTTTCLTISSCLEVTGAVAKASAMQNEWGKSQRWVKAPSFHWWLYLFLHLDDSICILNIIMVAYKWHQVFGVFTLNFKYAVFFLDFEKSWLM